MDNMEDGFFSFLEESWRISIDCYYSFDWCESINCFNSGEDWEIFSRYFSFLVDEDWIRDL